MNENLSLEREIHLLTMILSPVNSMTNDDIKLG